MSFLRPEARAALWRWRDLLAGLALGAVGLFWVIGSGGMLRWIGFAVVAIGAMLIGSGVQRGRFLRRDMAPGAGVIELDERQLSFMGPDTGVIVPLGAVVRIEIETLGIQAGDDLAGDDLHWVFFTEEGEVSKIPASALGHEKLFDCLSGFPGAHYEKVIAASTTTQAGRFVIWRKQHSQPILTRH